MTAKEYLGRAFIVHQTIITKLEELKRLEDMLGKCTSVITDMPRIPYGYSSFEQTLTTLMSKKEEISSNIQALEKERDAIEHTIEQLQDTNIIAVLKLRYLHFKSWQEICSLLKCSMRTVHRRHGAGLVILNRMLEENPKTF